MISQLWDHLGNSDDVDTTRAWEATAAVDVRGII